MNTRTLVALSLMSSVMIGCGDSGSGTEGNGETAGTADAADSADTADTADTEDDDTCPMIAGTPIDLSAGFEADDSYFYEGMGQAIQRRAIAGGEPELIVELDDTLVSPLAVGDAHLFFVAGSDAWRVDKAGGVPESLGEVPGQVVQVTTDGEAFYFASLADAGIELRRASVVGGPTTLLTTLTTEGVTEMVSDGEHLYWLGFQPANVWRVPVGGGDEQQVADSSSEMAANITGHGLALAGDEVLWSATYQSYSDGRLFAIPKDGGERRVLTASGTTTGFRVLDQTVYIALTGTSESQIAAVPLDGGPRSLAACVADKVLDLEALPSGLYVRVDGQTLNFPL